MIALFVVYMWLEIMLAEGEDWSEEGRGEFLVHLPRPLKGYKRHEAIHRGEGLRPEVSVRARVIVGM
jgi:hypothetical protein